MKEKYDIIECYFLNNNINNVFSIKQYGKSENQIEQFWKSYFSNPKKDKYTFISCRTIEKNVEVDNDDLKEIWWKKLEIDKDEYKNVKEEKHENYGKIRLFLHKLVKQFS